MEINFVVVYDTKSVSNIAGNPEALLQHSQEEADALLLQAKNVRDNDDSSCSFTSFPNFVSTQHLELAHLHPILKILISARSIKG